MQPTSHIWMNGQFLPWDEAKVHVLAHTLHYGGGAFEGIRCYKTDRGPAVFRLKEHMERLHYSSAVLPPDGSMGIFGQLHYVHDDTGLEAALRYAYLEPSNAQTDDRVQEISAMIGYRPFKGPIRVVLQYEHREEETAVAIGNDSLILFLHAFF